MNQAMKLGDVLRDTITGFTGVAVSRTEWLNGCVRYALQPRELHEGKPIDCIYLDQEQLELVEERKSVNFSTDHTGGDRPNPVRAQEPRR